MFCFGSAVFWFVLGCALQALASAKLVIPGLLDGIGFLSYGRVAPAAANAMVYGWASLAGIGLAIWLVTRTSGGVIRASVVPVCAVIAWNLAMVIGVLAVLGGASGGVPGLEMPGGVAIILLLAFLVIAVWCLAALRNASALYISQQWLVAALLAFPWLYATGNAVLRWNMVSGSAMGGIHAWFEGGLFGLWLAPLAFAAIFHFLPLAAGRPLFSGGLASIGFWSFLACAAWMGTSRYQGGPIPAWMVTAGVVATILLLMPTIAISANIHGTVDADYERIWAQAPARFLMTAAGGFLLWACIAILVTLPPVNSVVHFSVLTAGLFQTGLLGFVTMALIGVVYAFCEGLRPVTAFTSRSSLIFWLLFTGVGLIVTATFFGGFFQGFALMDPEVTFANSVTYASPFRWVEFAGQLCVFFASLGLARDVATWILTVPGESVASVDEKEVASV